MKTKPGVKKTNGQPDLMRQFQNLNLLEIANPVGPVEGRIHIEKINEPFLCRDGGSPVEFGGGLKLVIDRGWLTLRKNAGRSSPSRRPARNCSRVKKWAAFSKCREPDIG